MGLNEQQEFDDYLDFIICGQPDTSDTDSIDNEIICRCGPGRGRDVQRTVPRLPQAAIHHRISLMELRANSPSGSSQGSRRGRGRARILRENAASLPAVGKSKKKATIPEPVQKVDRHELESIPKKTPADNWSLDEFPTLDASHQEAVKPSLKGTRNGRRKPHFKEIRERISELQFDLKGENNTENGSNEEMKQDEIKDDGVEISEKSDFDVNQGLNGNPDTLTTEGDNNKNDNVREPQEPKINKRNFMELSKIEFQKMVPKGFTSKFKSNRTGQFRYHSHNYKHDKSYNVMDRAVLNDDLPEYCKYEVTHDDIRRHKEKSLKVPDSVKDRVNDWMRQTENSKENTIQDKTVFDDAEGDTIGKEADYNANILLRQKNDVCPNNQDVNINDCAVIIGADEPDICPTGDNINCDNDIIYATKMKDENSSVNADDDEEIQGISQEINELGNSFLNDLNFSSNGDKHMHLNSSELDTSNIYISDEESNMILESALSATKSQVNIDQKIIRDQRLDNPLDSKMACLSESDFVTKYQANNEIKSKTEKDRRSTGMSSDPGNGWRLDGKTVIQVDGLTRNCVVTDLEKMVGGFGTVSDFEQKQYGDKLSVRFKLHDEDACDFAVQCLHDTDCIFPDSVLRCFKVC